jgi:ubiquinone/menaquinone biosynthesis C-methylase UbiE
MTNADSNPVEAGYDAVYAAMPASATLRRLWRDHAAGADFPDEFAHISFVTLSQLQRMTEELRLAPGKSLVDVGCGLAGPALWVAKQTGAQLIGVDLSSVAVAKATERAAALGLSGQARFAVGTFAETGLSPGSADAMMSEDALQYAADKSAALREAARVLRPGGRFVFTAFELEPARVAGLPILGADPVDDYRRGLEAAGFSVDAYEEVPGWPEPMTEAYSAVLAAREALIAEMGEAAVGALTAEMSLTLEVKPYRRRVLAVATKR